MAKFGFINFYGAGNPGMLGGLLRCGSHGVRGWWQDIKASKFLI
jgi:hypothetical protein